MLCVYLFFFCFFLQDRTCGGILKFLIIVMWNWRFSVLDNCAARIPVSRVFVCARSHAWRRFWVLDNCAARISVSLVFVPALPHATWLEIKLKA